MSERTVHSLLMEAAARFGTSPALYEPVMTAGQRGYRTYSWIEYRGAVEEIAAGLRRLGLERGDIIALVAETCLEFYLADLGVMAHGGIAAALYTSYPPQEQVKTLRACDAKAVFVENSKMLGAILSAADPPLDVRWILLTGENGDAAITLPQLRAEGRRALQEQPDLPEKMHQDVRADDYAILYLTSGATGEPKMGLVTHAAIVANVDMAPKVVDLGPRHRSIAFLPPAHITQRLAMELLPIRVGMPVWFSAGLSRLPHEMKSVRPTFLVAPPRVWERVYQSICAEIKKRGALTQRLFYGALGLGLEVYRRRQQDKSVPAWMARLLGAADRMVFRKIRERLGGEMELPVSGAAPLGKDLADFYGAIGMPIYEGYGLTEGGIVALNPIGKTRSGSIGHAFAGVEMKLGPDNELLIRSATLFSGYYQDPEATAAVLREGWLHTGDIADIDKQGYIYITGRKKEVLVSSNGKKIYPAMIESLFKLEPLINQVLLLGDKMPYVAALFTLNPSVAESLKGMDAYKGRAPEELVMAPPVAEEVKRLVARINKQLAPFEQIRRYHVLERDFTIEDGEITPTMKVRRNRVLENHRKVIGALFVGRDEAL